MSNGTPKVQYLKDYQPSDFLLTSVFLHFDLHEEHTVVKTILNVKRNSESANKNAPLILNGEEMQLKGITLDGASLGADQYTIDAVSLTIPNVPDVFILETTVEIKPQENTRLSGLYKSGKNFCTQCESHGFRRITYFLDRPDVLTQFTTTITADKTRYPILLSNGNLTDQQNLQDNRHWVKWEDPTRKPCYLFALVAGDLEGVKDQFVTQSGRTVQLEIYVEPGKCPQAVHAMQSLKAAMRWDEENYGREYDLDIYLIVAVSDFNFGAMENKGLNIFNDKYILAKPETATDDDFINVQGVIAHEYFHNWSGNRVTVRDWFQITLKEGLTVFREHQFTADKTSKVVKRIEEAKMIRSAQFLQDAGPMAHPIYPDSYIEINNFYTVTVYEKGSEVIRMMHTLLGPETFRKAMDLYFTRNDGYPVTVEEFVKAMEDASGIDLVQFRRWYKQSGTPALVVKENYDAVNKTYTLTIEQSCPATPGQSQKEPFHIPFVLGLLDKQGKDMSLQLQGEREASSATRVFSLKKPQETLQFVQVAEKPLPSLLRNFSAPVKLQYDYTEEQLIFLMAHDSDAFNRWDAGQKLAIQILMRLIQLYQQQLPMSTPQNFLQALENIFVDTVLDAAFKAEILTLPSEVYLGEQMAVVDVEAIHAAREWLKLQIATRLRDKFNTYYAQHSHDEPYQLTAKAVGERRLKNLSLMYLALLENSQMYAQCVAHFQQANNMTDAMGAMTALMHIPCAQREQILEEFFKKWQHESLVMDKWFMVQAQSALPDAIKRVRALTEHPLFDLKNPNRARALLGAFAAGNPLYFHDKSGEGYALLADYVLRAEKFNPQLAARLIEPLIHWKRYDNARQGLMRAQLERLKAVPQLSKDLFEVVSKSLV